MKASQKGVPAVALAGATRNTEVARDEQATPIKGFLAQLADLFNVAPRLEAAHDGNFSAGARDTGRGGVQLGGGRPR